MGYHDVVNVMRGLMIRTFRDWFLDQLAMYAAYHTDRRNQLTHYVGVPLIVFSILIALAQIGIGSFTDAGMLLLCVLLLAYVVATPLVGAVCAAIYIPLYLVAADIAGFAPGLRWLIIGGCFVVGWAIQFVGHIFEGRRPAFTVNMLQIFMAPAFLVAEALFAIGLQKDLSRILQVRAQKYAQT